MGGADPNPNRGGCGGGEASQSTLTIVTANAANSQERPPLLGSERTKGSSFFPLPRPVYPPPLNPRRGGREGDVEKCSKYLADLTLESLSKVFSRAREVQAWLRSVGPGGGESPAYDWGRGAQVRQPAVGRSVGGGVGVSFVSYDRVPGGGTAAAIATLPPSHGIPVLH